MILRLSAYNKLLNFVPGTNSVDSTGLPTLRQPISNALCLQGNIVIESIITNVASLASISGVTLKTLVQRHLSDHATVKRYVKWLEGKKVLYAPFDKEVHGAVVTSIEEIKKETEVIRSHIKDEFVSIIMLHLILRMSEELMVLHSLDVTDPKHSAKMYRSIQEVRAKFASAIALLCASHKINLAGSTLAQLVADLGFRQKRG